MSFIPRKARQILRSPQLQRQFFLKPYGLDIPKNMNFPKKHPQYKFIQHRLVLFRPGKEVNPNTLTFRTNPRLSKPQLKQYIEKLYNIQIQKVNTARFMGKVYMTHTRRAKVTKNWKKAFVITKNKIDPFLNSPI